MPIEWNDECRAIVSREDAMPGWWVCGERSLLYGIPKGINLPPQVGDVHTAYVPNHWSPAVYSEHAYSPLEPKLDGWPEICSFGLHAAVSMLEFGNALDAAAGVLQFDNEFLYVCRVSVFGKVTANPVHRNKIAGEFRSVDEVRKVSWGKQFQKLSKFTYDYCFSHSDLRADESFAEVVRQFSSPVYG